VHKKAGKKPVWDYMMKFSRTPDVFMKVGVYSSDFFTDAQVGVTTVNLKKFVSNPGVEFNGRWTAM